MTTTVNLSKCALSTELLFAPGLKSIEFNLVKFRKESTDTLNAEVWYTWCIVVLFPPYTPTALDLLI